MAAGERVSQYLIGLGADDTDLRTLMTGVKSRFASDVADLKRTGDKLDLFSTLTDNVPKVQAALDRAKASVKSFADQIDQIKGKGGTVTKDLTDGLAQAEKAAASATKELSKQQQQLATLGNQLQRAGVDTGNLSAAQIKLTEATRAAAAAAEVQAAKQTLGLVTVRDTTAEAAKLRAAFDTLKNSGVLSATETAIAQQRLQAELKALNDSVTKVGGGVKTLGSDLKAAFTSIGGPVLAAVGGITAVTAAIGSAIAAAKEYRQAMAEASSGTDLTTEATAALSRKAQDLAQELGLNVNESVRSLFGLLKAGVPEDNVVDVLRIAAEAAKASLSDVGTGTKIAKLLLNDLKIPAADLSHAFDVLKVTVGGSKEGFEAFANSAGPLLAVAKASNISLEDLTATLRAMTKAGLDTDDAIGALQKIIIAIGSPETKAKLQGIGITATDLVGVFTQLGEKGAKLQDVLDLTGLSKKQAGAAAAIINDTKRLGEQLDKTAQSAGAVAKANAKLYDSPKEISDRFHATLDVTKQKLGELAGASGKATTLVTYLLDKFNKLADAQARYEAIVDGQQAAYDRAALVLLGFGEAERKAADEASNLAAAQAAAKQAADDHAAAITAERDKLATQGEALIKNALALQAAIEVEAKAIEERSRREIAAIELAAGARRKQGADDLAAAETARVAAGVRFELGAKEITVLQNVDAARAQSGITAKQAAADILAAQQEAADKELKLIAENEIKITAEHERGLAARRDAAKGNQAKLRELDAEDLASRTELAGKIVGQYARLYDSLYQQAKSGQDKVNAVDSERLSFNEQIALKLRAIRQEGISDAESYAQKLRDIDELTSKAKRALDEGDFKLGKQYTDDAIKTAESLTKVVNSEGATVISQLEVQQTKIRTIKGAADQYSAALRGQGDAAQEGAAKAADALKTVGVLLEVYERRLENLRLKSAEAIVQKIEIALDGVEQARGIIAELVKPQTKYIHIVAVKPGEAAPTTPTSPLDLGVPFASGGPVFRRPSWSKVPGSGSGDTVPALLETGSFVMRKAAVAKYGDGVMSSLVRGYAAGGDVLPYLSGLLFGKIPGAKKTEAEKIAEYLNSLPPAEQQRIKDEIAAGGTEELIAKGEIADGMATQARGAPKPIAPVDISPTPDPSDAVTYGRFIETHLKTGGIMALVKEQIGTYINQVQRSPFDQALIQGLVRSARAAAANNFLESIYGKTVFGGQKDGFANLPDWYDFIAQLHAPGNPLHHGVDFRTTRHGFATGGPVDTIPAMLTPGEVVLNPSAVQSALRMFGGGFLDAMNAGRLNFAPPPMPRGYAMGGPVGDVPGWRGSSNATAGATYNITIKTPHPVSDKRVLRELAIALDNQRRLSGKPPL
jgi:TP901 family phage tail tape measure protein